MISQVLRDARKYEETAQRAITREMRPGFHLSPRVGWMNDPNGFSFYNGKYHLFYQYNPYSSHWDTMHWGHAVSSDLLHWEYLPAALAPDTACDRDGCFSGSAITLPDGRQMLIYTGVEKINLSDGSDCVLQRQCLAVGDGVDYEKYGENPVLDESSLPQGSSKYDFRDPKIFARADGSYGCVVGNCDGDRDGRVLLFGSPDGFSWEFERILAENKKRFGKMWECPDFFELNGKQVVIVSPQEMLPQGFEYHNGNGTLCLIGHDDGGKFVEEHNQSVDYGIDFYAPQTVLAPDGRRIMIGWMQNWDTCPANAPNQPWFGQMSLPRELSIKDGRLHQQPVREIESLRKNEVRYENIKFTDVIKLDGIEGRKVDLEILLRPGDMENIYHKFAVRFAQNDKFQTSVSFRPHERVVKIDRKFSGSRRVVIHQRRSLVRTEGGVLKLRIILDLFSAEIFVNDGEHVLTATMYTERAADEISFFADGAVTMDVVKYDLVAEEK